MALEIFLKLGDIKVDSTDARHKDEIRVSSWDWGMAAAQPHGGGGAGGGAVRAEFRNLRFAHLIDAASPLIMLACASGRRLRDANLTVRRAGAFPFEFLIVKLSDVLVASIDAAVNEEKGELFESVTLGFGKLDLQFVPQSATGTAGSPARFAWDLQANAPLP
jgi:type VI secretion system secreted protein Hcp